MKKTVIIAFSAYMFIVLSCTEQPSVNEKKNVDSSEITFDGKTNSSKMKIKRELLNSTNYNELIYELIKQYYPEYDDENFDQLDKVTQTFVLIINMDGQVMNGGIIQFIDNGTGNYFHETVDAVERIKSTGFVKVLNKAAKQFPNGAIPKDWELRRKTWDELGEKHTNQDVQYEIVDEEWEEFWEKLDSYYYDNSDVLYKNLIEYLKTNATLID